MSKLLIEENPLIILPSLANEVGLDVAIALQQLHYRQQWEEGHTDPNEGYHWVTRTYSEWKDGDFPFWGVQKIGRVFRALSELPFIHSTQLSSAEWDRTKSYRINYKQFSAWEEQLLTIEGSKMNVLDSSNLNTLHIKENLRESTREKTDYIQAMETLEETFAHARGCPLPEWKNPKSDNKLWRTPMKQIWKACGEDTSKAARVVVSAVRRMTKDDMTVVTPASILKVALSNVYDGKDNIGRVAVETDGVGVHV